MDPFTQAQLKIAGDPTVALIAQINRWKKRAGLPEYPLTPTLSLEVAKDALVLMQARLALALTTSADLSLTIEMAEIHRAYDNPVPYVNARLSTITQTLARYGDSLGLPQATVGIVQKSPGIATWKLVLAIGGGLLAIGSIAAMARRRRGLAPAAADRVARDQ